MEYRCANNWCQKEFEVSESELRFLEKFNISTPPPCCPDCRHQQRAQFLGQLAFYRRTSSLSGSAMVSLFSEHAPFPVYSSDEWWGEDWDAMSFGLPYDDSRSLFEQFGDLMRTVPEPAMANFHVRCWNSDYCSYAGDAKNCYYSTIVYRSENICFSENITRYCQYINDCFRCFESSHLFECVECRGSHYSSYLLNCDGCRDSHFCVDCRGCHNCLFCSNLRTQEYHVFNKPVSRIEYERIKASVLDGRFTTAVRNLAAWKDVLEQAIWPALRIVACEDVSGDMLSNSARCVNCYRSANCVDVWHSLEVLPSEKCSTSMDLTICGVGELLYNSVLLGGGNYALSMCMQCRESSYLTYCLHCFNSRNCLGCIGLRRAEFCILNRQYTEEEYRMLSEKIIDRMKADSEWGRFFPIELSPFAYNESMAMSIYPLSEQEVRQRGFRWAKLPELHPEAFTSKPLPDSIFDTSAEICEQVHTCSHTGRKFKYLPLEYDLCKLLGQPLPRVHPDVRMAARRQKLPERRLIMRKCGRCEREIETALTNEKNVWCLDCYQGFVL